MIMEDSSQCKICDCKERIIYEDKGYISCPNIRVAENLKFNVIMPIGIKTIDIEGVLLIKEVTSILLVRRGGGLGDLIITSVVTRGIKEKFPESKLTYFCHKKYIDILKNNPFIDEIVTEVDTKQWNEDYNLVIELDNPCPCYVYEAKHMNNPKDITRPRVDLFCKRAGVDPKDKKPFLVVGSDDSSFVETFLDKIKPKKIKIALAPVSSEAMKNWPEYRVKGLVDLINKKLKATVFILNDTPIHIEDAVGIFSYPIGFVMALISKMDLVVSVDTGVIQVAGALDRPLIGLFGVTAPERYMSYFNNVSWIHKQDKFACSPCYYLHKCIKIPSPCLDAITSEEVFNEVKKSLSHSGA